MAQTAGTGTSYLAKWGNEGLGKLSYSTAVSKLCCRSRNDITSSNDVNKIAASNICSMVELQDSCNAYSKNGLTCETGATVLSAETINLTTTPSNLLSASPLLKLKYALNVELERWEQYHANIYTAGGDSEHDDWNDVSVVNSADISSYANPKGHYVDYVGGKVFEATTKASVSQLVSKLSSLVDRYASQTTKDNIVSVLSDYTYGLNGSQASSDVASKDSANAILSTLSILQSECMCYTDCDGYSVCYCYNYCSNY